MDSPRTRPDNVVDLNVYREARRRAALPLFDGPQPAQHVPSAPTTTVPRTRTARLNTSQVEHRHRMLRFLLGH